MNLRVRAWREGPRLCAAEGADRDLPPSALRFIVESVVQDELQEHGFRLTSVLRLLRSLDPAFNYVVSLSSDGTVCAVMWMTSEGLERLRLYGDVVLLDATWGTNELRWPLFPICVLNEEGKVRTVAIAITCHEQSVAHAWVLRALRALGVGWEPRTVFADGALDDAVVKTQLGQQAKLMLCTWHMFEVRVIIPSARLSPMLRWTWRVISPTTLGATTSRRTFAGRCWRRGRRHSSTRASKIWVHCSAKLWRGAFRCRVPVLSPPGQLRAQGLASAQRALGSSLALSDHHVGSRRQQPCRVERATSFLSLHVARLRAQNASLKVWTERFSEAPQLVADLLVREHAEVSTHMLALALFGNCASLAQPRTTRRPPFAPFDAHTRATAHS